MEDELAKKGLYIDGRSGGLEKRVCQPTSIILLSNNYTKTDIKTPQNFKVNYYKNIKKKKGLFSLIVRWEHQCVSACFVLAAEQVPPTHFNVIEPILSFEFHNF
jgi:hypothetical protein